MRDVILTCVILGALPVVLRHAWVGVILWTWLSIMNPHRLTWGFAHDAPFAAIAAGATFLGLFFTKDRVSLPRSDAFYAFIAFVVWMCATTVLAVFPEGSLGQLNKIAKIQLMTVVALAVLHEKKQIQLFVWINALSIGFYGVKGGLHTIQTGGGGRVWGPGGFIGGNNEVGLAILVAIPLLYYLYLTAERRWILWGLIGAMLLSAIAVLGTQSRGAFLAIAVMSVMLWWRAPKKLLFGTALVAVAAVVIPAMPGTWSERMGTITEYKRDSSAMGRINSWETAVNIANRRPFGAGFNMYNSTVFSAHAPVSDEERASDPSIVRAAHSIYFQVLGEHGWVGLAIFVTIWLLVWRDAGRIRKLARDDLEFRWALHLAGMCQVALVGYGVGGAFLSLAYFDLPYNLLVVVVVTQRWLVAQLEQRRKAAAAAAPATIAAPAQRRIAPVTNR